MNVAFNKIRKNNLYSNILIMIVFLLITVAITLPLMKYGRIAIKSDGSFHFSRAEEIFRNLKSGNFFTFIATHTFHSSGVANFLFYPSVFLYPWAILRFILNPINSFYVWYGMMMFVTMIISFYSMNVYSKHRMRSFSFALFYTFSGYHLYLGAWNYVLGEFIAFSFLPLLFVGIYNILWDDGSKWYLLGIGFSLVAYSHVLSLIMASTLILLLVISKIVFDYNNINKKIFLNIVKSAALALLMMSWTLVPFITDYIKSGIFTPEANIYFTYSLSQGIIRALDNGITNQNIGFLLLITAFLGWIFVKNNKKETNIYLLGVSLALCSTLIIPWYLLINTSVSVIQFPYRLLSFACLFLSATASFIIIKIKIKSNYVVTGLTLIVIIGYFGSIAPTINSISVPTSLYWSNNKIDPTVRVPDLTQLDKNNYSDLFKYSIKYGEVDYYSTKSFSSDWMNSDPLAHTIVQHKTTIGNKDIVLSPKIKSNQISYTVKSNKNSKIDLPIVAYNNTQVKINNKKVNFTSSSRGTVEVKASSTVNKIEVSYKPKIYFYVAFYIAVATWISLIILGMYKLFNKKQR